MRARRRWGFLCAAIISAARAEAECESDTVDWVEVSLPADATLDAGRFLKNLRTELRSRGAHFCVDGPQTLPRAQLKVEQRSNVAYRLVVTPVQGPPVERAVDVAQIPLDGRTVTLALSACELLNAQWPPTPPPLPALRQPVRPVPEVRQLFEVELAGTAESWSGRPMGVGLEARGFTRTWGNLFVGLRLGARALLPFSAPSGKVVGTAAALGAEARWRFIDATVGFEAALRLDGLVVHFEGAPFDLASVNAQSAFGATAAAAALASFKLSDSMRVFVDAQLSGALSPVVLIDSGAAFGGISGLGLSASIGLRRSL